MPLLVSIFASAYSLHSSTYSHHCLDRPPSNFKLPWCDPLMSDVFFPLDVLGGSFWGHLFQYANASCCPLLSSDIAQKCGGRFHGRAMKEKGKISQLEVEDIVIYPVSPWVFSWAMQVGHGVSVSTSYRQGYLGAAGLTWGPRQETRYVNCGDIQAVSQAGL